MKQVFAAHCFKKAYIHFMEYVADYVDHPERTAIEQRLEILKFFDEFGLEATKRAFKKGRSTIFSWKQRLVKAGGKLSALAPGNRCPIRKRKRIIDPFIASFIIDYRASHPGADKTTIAPALTAACLQAGIKPISESTIGRIIHDLKQRGSLPKTSRIRIYGTTGKLRESGRARP